MLAQLQEKYPEDVRLVYRHFPLIGTPEKPFHDKAALSAQAAESAGLQGKFWEMHDLLFERQQEWSSLTVEQFRSWLAERANELVLDQDRFLLDLDSEAITSMIQGTWDWGLQIGLPGTPFLLLNGRIWDLSVPINDFNLSSIIKLIRLEERQYTTCPPMSLEPGKRYTATIKTEKGDVVLELFPDEAPLAVNNFIFLARNGWYDNVTFHKVLPGAPNSIVQAGDPSGTGFGGPGYAFDNEIDAGLLFDREGKLAMANAGEGSNGSQFFITLAPRTDLNGVYTIFGQVLSGMEVLRALNPRDPAQSGDLPSGDLILTITIQEEK